jgi:hypothetical protein
LDDIENRKLQFQHSGFIPLTKGSTIQIHNTFRNQAILGTRGLESFEETMKRYDISSEEKNGLPPASDVER